ncbi:hypothetical protein J4207_00750 [Candidatus Woesearchaeota archaeon]|nr:hypothetical protein [Candidatus Woesearchaeota archaeon]HLC80381.1 hypothetical protein [Candidatus Nanoarchaeia archaeon]
MEFWNSVLTEKSWNLLQELKKENFRFIVIGGWATYLWTKQHKSKDIDVVIPDFMELEQLKQKYELFKNDSLKKYEIKFGEIDLDIYVPFYSRLTLPMEEITADVKRVESFEVVSPEVLLILKQGAEKDRGESIKGQKDKIDILTLLCFTEIDFKKYYEMLERNDLLFFRQRLKEIVNSFRDVEHLGMNVKDYAKIKKELLCRI